MPKKKVPIQKSRHPKITSVSPPLSKKCVIVLSDKVREGNKCSDNFITHTGMELGLIRLRCYKTHLGCSNSSLQERKFNKRKENTSISEGNRSLRLKSTRKRPLRPVEEWSVWAKPHGRRHQKPEGTYRR